MKKTTKLTCVIAVLMIASFLTTLVPAAASDDADAAVDAVETVSAQGNDNTAGAEAIDPMAAQADDANTYTKAETDAVVRGIADSKVNAPIIKQEEVTAISITQGKLYDFAKKTEFVKSNTAYADYAVEQGKSYMISGMAAQNADIYCLGGFLDSAGNLLQVFGTEKAKGGTVYTDYVVSAPAEAVTVRVNTCKAAAYPIVCCSTVYDTDCIPDLMKELSANTKSISDVRNMLGMIPYEIKSGYYKTDGSYREQSGYECGVVTLDVAKGEEFLYRGNGGASAASVVLFDASGKVVSMDQWDPTDYHEVKIPQGVTKALFSSFRNVKKTSSLVFELYKDGGFFRLYKMIHDSQSSSSPSPAPQSAAPKTLNTANRLYAAETMGNSKELRPLDKAVFCVGFDDYNLDCAEAVQYLAEQGLPSYLSLIPDRVTDDWAMAKLCYENGGEIAAHSGTVLTNQNQTFELMNDKFIDIPERIGQAGFPVYGIITAGGTGQNTEDKSLDEYFCRAAGLKYSDYYGESTQYTLGRNNLTRKTLDEWKKYLNKLEADKGYCISFCHHVNGLEKNAYPDGFTMDDFKAIIAEVQKRDIEVMTINEFVDRYIYNIPSTDSFVR